MNRKTMRHKLMELTRRLHFQKYGTYKGWGKVQKFYDRNWKAEKINTLGGYKAAWESETMRALRASLGM